MGKWHGGKGTRLYGIWKGMKSRCYNKNHSAYSRYGGRGITVCDEWINSFPTFRDWAFASGYADDLTLDRKENALGYTPGNCRWVTYKEQANNTRRSKIIEYNGETGTIAALCEKYNINPFLVYDRIGRLGWDVAKAMSTPARAINK